MTVQYMNKALFTLYGFTFPITVALLQMAVIAPVCYIVAKPKLEWGIARGILPLALVNVLNVVCGLMGTAGLNVPMFIALRRFTLLCTIVLERFMMGKKHDRSTIGAVGIMIGGAVIAAATDLSFSLSGYSAVIGNDFLTALYLILVKNTPATAGLTTTGLLFYNAALSLPILGVALAASKEPAGIIAYPDSDSWGFRVVLIMCCMLGLTINHSTFICTRFNDPLTTSVAGSVKNIIMTCIGAVSFGDFIYAKWNVVGLGVSMMGAVWYATRAAMKARKRGLAQQLLMRDPNKTGPMIGKDRLGALRATEAARNGGTQLAQLPAREQQSTAASPSSSPSAPLVSKRVENV
ncbi:hypothetical protein CVIRNUC_004008 [Coccomyxa viridis]|uniref:Sugar phosphate transporter domain-containing protein n=1 Tax=Coccomyxa viridis TaxID=1274662 RepID=A0AAV1I131_9CHLO|nr:hypothetical protein CVIRNUC_004008 [Coccomyxa viridis]